MQIQWREGAALSFAQTVQQGTTQDNPSTLGGSLARMPNGFRIDRVIGAMIVVAWKEPDFWFSA
jgi:hypothetical protein